MNGLARILAILLLAVFAPGTAAHAASATSMSLAMSAVAMTDGDMGDCERCPPGDDGKARICGQVCLAPFAAMPAVGVEVPVAAGDAAISPVAQIDGLTGPPEPYPPRTTIPS